MAVAADMGLVRGGRKKAATYLLHHDVFPTKPIVGIRIVPVDLGHGHGGVRAKVA